MNGKKHALRSRWWLLIWCGFVTMGLAGGLEMRSARAAQPMLSLRKLGPVLPACSQCISDISPADGSTVQTDANGKVTISVTAQLNNNYTKFEIQIDQTAVDPTQIQVTGDPTAPTAQVQATLPGGKHHVFAQVDDASGPVAAVGWDFTLVVTATPTPTLAPTTVPTRSGGGSGGGSSTNPTAAKSGILLNTVSLVFFSVAVVGLLVIAFIAGMWYGGRRLPTS
jgi:hypothetical protein